MTTKTCEHCGNQFTPKWPNRPNRFCSRSCYNAAGRRPQKAVTKGHRMKRIPGHPLAPSSGIVVLSRVVLYDKIGPGEHPCHWCKKPVRWIVGGGPGTPSSLLADHLDWDIQNNSPDNLVPSCHLCNSHRAKSRKGGLIGSEELTVMWGGTRTRAIERHCNNCGTAFLVPPAELKSGRGRFCSRSCARRTPRQQGRS